MRHALALLLVATAPLVQADAAPPQAAPPKAGPPRSAATATQDAALLQFLDRAFDEQLDRNPEALTQLGLKTHEDRLDDYTDAGARADQALAERQLQDMHARFRPDQLGESARVSYRLFEYEVTRGRESLRFRRLRFPVSTTGSPAGDIPVLLINNHRIDTLADARAYIARLRDTERVMREVAATMREQAAAGIVPNKVNFAPARSDARAVVTGAPFDAGPDSTLLADFRKKVTALDVPPATRTQLIGEASAALTGPFRRGYDVLFAALDAVEPLSKGNFGAWSLPDGAAYYADRLKTATTTDLTAEQIHALGLRQVATIRQEMEGIKREVGFTGTLDQFFDKIRTDPQFKYPNTAAGRQAYLGDARAVIAGAMAAAPRYFRVLPKAPLEVRAVEPWRERTASTAFYDPPSADGSRPGIYYVNLIDMTQTQKVQVAGIAAHEGAPGHHFQIARQQELTGIPKFRKYGGYGAYAEGWASMPSGSPTRWGSTRIPMPGSACCRCRCGERSGWCSTPASTRSAGIATRRSPISGPTARSPTPTSRARSIAISIGPARRPATWSASCGSARHGRGPSARWEQSSTSATSTKSCSTRARCRSTCSTNR